jgi:hypothetical protein
MGRARLQHWGAEVALSLGASGEEPRQLAEAVVRRRQLAEAVVRRRQLLLLEEHDLPLLDVPGGDRPHVSGSAPLLREPGEPRRTAVLWVANV